MLEVVMRSCPAEYWLDETNPSGSMEKDDALPSAAARPLRPRQNVAGKESNDGEPRIAATPISWPPLRK